MQKRIHKCFPSPNLHKIKSLCLHSSLQTESSFSTKESLVTDLNIFLEEVVQDHFINCWAQLNCTCWNVRCNGLMEKENRIRRILLCSVQSKSNISKQNWMTPKQFLFRSFFAWRAKVRQPRAQPPWTRGAFPPKLLWRKPKPTSNWCFLANLYISSSQSFLSSFKTFTHNLWKNLNRKGWSTINFWGWLTFRWSLVLEP